MKKAKNMNEEGCLVIEKYPIEAAGNCVILPTLNLAFGIGNCPQKAVSQPFIFISHAHMDHIGGLSMYVASRGMLNLEPPTIIVPTVIKQTVEKIFEPYRAISELKYTLIGLDIGEEFYFTKGTLKAKAFKTYHGGPSQGYVIYSVKKGKLKPDYLGLPKDEITKLKFEGVKIEDAASASPEVAFAGDTTADFIVDKDNVDVLKAKILIMESRYIDNTKTVKDARDHGHTHLSEIINYASRFQNKAILLIHFSARYKLDAIEEAISALPPPLAGRVFALKKGFYDFKEQENMNDCLVIENYPIKGGSKAGQQTCVILPTLNLAFDIGNCPEKAVSQPFIFISHGHNDHIGGLPMYVASRGIQNLEPPTIIVPTVIKDTVEKIFEPYRAISELKYTLVGLDIGEEYYFRDDLKAKAFKTYHRVPSQGYVIYSVKKGKLNPDYLGLPKDEITKFAGVKIEYEAAASPEVAFTGDTTADFIIDKDNIDVLKAKILIMESTYIDNTKTVKDARDYGHTHLSEIINYASRFENKAILLIHFSPRYKLNAIEAAISALPPPLAGRVFALTEGFKGSKEQE